MRESTLLPYKVSSFPRKRESTLLPYKVSSFPRKRESTLLPYKVKMGPRFRGDDEYITLQTLGTRANAVVIPAKATNLTAPPSVSLCLIAKPCCAALCVL